MGDRSMEKNKQRNRTSKQMLTFYQTKLAELENLWFVVRGSYPTERTKQFWGHRKVKQIESLLVFWWDIVQIEEGRK
jgi:hypothetical protein